MPIQHYSANNNYLPMSCHVFALSGDTTTMANIHSRYTDLGDYLFGVTAMPASGVLPNLVNATVSDIKKANQLSEGPYRINILNLLCKEFGLQTQKGSATRLYGVFKPGQKLPMHMYVTYNNMIYDTLVDASIRRDDDNEGTNPPSETDVLDKSLIASVGVATLAPATMAVINAPATDWANGL